MSRIRIVKGKITEIVGGDYKIFSESNIVESATGQLQEMAKEGAFFGEPAEAPPKETLANCVISFRPDQNYEKNPSFGFDWLKIGDTGYKGDVWYFDVIGKYNPRGEFEQNSNEYTRISNTFERIILKSKKDKGDKNYLYYVPKMTLRKGFVANLILKISIEEEPKTIKFSYDKSCFEISDYENDEIKSKGKGIRVLPIKIKAKEIFDSRKHISILADEQICGKLTVMPNNFSYNLKVVFVEIKTRIGNTVQLGAVQELEKANLRRILGQAYVKVEISKAKLDLSGFFTSAWFRHWYTTKSGKIKTKKLFEYLNEKLNRQQNEYKDHYKIYVFGASADNLNGRAEKIGQGAKSSVVFPGRIDSDKTQGTSAHELLHTMGLYHTFDNNSMFTFQKAKLNNIMDYSHHRSIPRVSTTHWQWKIMQKSMS